MTVAQGPGEPRVGFETTWEGDIKNVYKEFFNDPKVPKVSFRGYLGIEEIKSKAINAQSRC